MQAQKDNDGNRDTRIQRRLSKSQRNLDGTYPGGLLQYCHDLESVYEELRESDVEVDDDIKRYNLLGNLESVDSTEAKFLTHHCREKFSTFYECLKHLKLYSSRQNAYTFQRSVRHANLTCIDDNNPQEEDPEMDMESLSQLCSHASQETTYENMRRINNVVSETKKGIHFSSASSLETTS